MSLSRATNIILIVIASVFILVMTKNYLLPFVLALVIWYLIRVIREFIRKSDFIRNKFPSWLQNLIVFSVVLLSLVGVSELLVNSIQNFTKVLPDYQNNLRELNQNIAERFDVNLLDRLKKYSGDYDLAGIVQPILNSLTSLVSSGVIIIIYLIFLIIEEPIFKKKFNQILQKDPEDEKRFLKIWSRIDASFSSYITLKTFVSFLTGIMSYFALLLLGVDSPGLWSIIIFLFNYIPNIGSIIATAFPVLVALLQFGEILPAVYVLVIVGAIQLFVGNFLEPRVMGNSLNISPLVVIITLTMWGAIWGVVGMVLSVPITVMMIIIFAQFPQTEDLAIILSETGKVRPEEDTDG